MAESTGASGGTGGTESGAQSSRRGGAPGGVPGGRPNWGNGGFGGGRPPRNPQPGPSFEDEGDEGDDGAVQGVDDTTAQDRAPAAPPNRPFGARPNYGAGAKPGAARQLADVAKKTARENVGKDAAGIDKGDMSDIARGDGTQGGRRRAATRAGKKAAVNSGRKALAGSTGGVSEGVIAGLRVAKIVLPIFLAFSLIMGVGIVAAIIGVASNNLNSQIPYALSAGALNSIPPEYLAAYQAAGQQYNVPWTVLAAVGQVATDQGRSAPSDIADYGKRIDRNPSAGANPLIGGGSSVSGSGSATLPANSHVSVIGDSLVGGTQSLFAAGLPGSQVTVDSRHGWEIGALTPVVASAANTGAKYVVVSAGTNDVWGLTESGTPGSAAKARIDGMLNALKPVGSGGGCALWVNVQNTTGSEYAKMDATASAYDQVLAGEVATHPWVTVVDWSGVAAATGGTVNAPDGLHLSSSGQALYVSTVLSALSTCATTAGKVVGSGLGAVSSVAVATNPNWTICGGANCAVNPAIGSKSGEAQGPLLLNPSWLAQNGAGRDPQSINDAAALLASALSTIESDILAADSSGQYAGYQSDPARADALWQAVVAQAPVELPSAAGVNVQSCSATATPPPSAHWMWPVADAAQAHMTLAFASTPTALGVDLAAPAGVAVLAAGDGTIQAVGDEAKGAGNYVQINHGSGYLTLYAHLASVNVKVGQHVTAGQTLGTVGSTGYTQDGAVLYFSLSNNGVPTDPATVLGSYSGKATAAANQANDSAINSGHGIVSAVMAEGSTGGQAVNPCTGAPLVPSVQTVQTSVDASGCPTSAFTNTIRYTKLTITQICQDSVNQAPTPVMAKAIIAAFEHLGMIYSQPKRNLPGYSDCSSFVSRMYEVAGVNMAPPGKNAPTTGVIANANWSASISSSQARPGDLEETSTYGHVVMVLADGMIAENSGDGDFSHVNPDWITGGHFYRIIPGQVPGTAPSVTADSGYFVPTNLGSVNASGGVIDNSTAAEVVQYSVYFGGDFAGDTRAGTFVTTAAGGVSAVSNSQVGAMIEQAWPQAQWKNAEAVSTCESHMNPLAEGTNSNGTHDMGVFQLNDGGTLQGLLTRTGHAATDTSLAYDAQWNVQAAYLLFKERGWEPWSCAQHLQIVVQNSAGQWVPGPGDTSGTTG